MVVVDFHLYQAFDNKVDLLLYLPFTDVDYVGAIDYISYNQTQNPLLLVWEILDDYFLSHEKFTSLLSPFLS